MQEFPSPKVFISYAWESEQVKTWVKQLAKNLRDNGIDVTLDQWELAPGDRMPNFMEMAVRDNNFVLIICSPEYKVKSEKRIGGVGYEGNIMTSEILLKSDVRKFIPILIQGNANNALPSWMMGVYYLDFSNPTDYKNRFDELMHSLLNIQEKAPALGEIPEKYRKKMEEAAMRYQERSNNDIILESKTEILKSEQPLAKAREFPRLEAELIWHGTSRIPRGYSSKNPKEVDENGRTITIITGKPIIFWDLSWRFEVIIHNNASYPAFNVKVKSIGTNHFDQLDVLPEVNNIPSLNKVVLKAELHHFVESDHTVADDILKPKIPQKLNGLILEISYQNENRENAHTIVKVEDQKLINTIEIP
jgi:hypothetical protein